MFLIFRYFFRGIRNGLHTSDSTSYFYSGHKGSPGWKNRKPRIPGNPSTSRRNWILPTTNYARFPCLTRVRRAGRADNFDSCLAKGLPVKLVQSSIQFASHAQRHLSLHTDWGTGVPFWETVRFQYPQHDRRYINIIERNMHAWYTPWFIVTEIICSDEIHLRLI